MYLVAWLCSTAFLSENEQSFWRPCCEVEVYIYPYTVLIARKSTAKRRCDDGAFQLRVSIRKLVCVWSQRCVGRNSTSKQSEKLLARKISALQCNAINISRAREICLRMEGIHKDRRLLRINKRKTLKLFILKALWQDAVHVKCVYKTSIYCVYWLLNSIWGRSFGAKTVTFSLP